MRIEDSAIGQGVRLFHADIRLAEWEMEALETWARDQFATDSRPLVAVMLDGFNRLLLGELRFVRQLVEVGGR